jgi:DNA adenine methylase
MNMNPPLKWAGGKRWLVPKLAEIYNRYRTFRLVEPFTGGASVTLGLAPSAALCADLNAPLINFYQQLKRGLTIPALDITEEGYYRNRARFNAIYRDTANHGVESAALFYYLNRRGFNGLCRFNKKGEFNLPFFKEVDKPLPALGDYREALQHVEFLHADFAGTLAQCGADDFIYADPPYDKSFTSYTAEGFSWADQVRLAEALIAHPGPAVISNLATDRIIDLYTKCGFALDYVQGPRRIAVPKKNDKTADRKPVREVLAIRFV